MSKFQAFIKWCRETTPRICVSAATLIILSVSGIFFAMSYDWSDIQWGKSLEERMDIYGRAPYVLRGYVRAGCLIGKYDFARNVLAEIVRQDPQDTASLQLLITLNMHSSPRDTTIQWAEMFIQVDSTNFDVLCDLGRLYYGVGDYDSALSWYERAYEVDSTNFRSICGVAETYDVLGNHSEEWSARCNKARANLQLQPAIIDPLERHIQIGPIDEQDRIGKSLYICAPVHSEKRTGPWFVAHITEIEVHWEDSTFNFRTFEVDTYDPQETWQTVKLIEAIAEGQEIYGYGKKVFFPGDDTSQKINLGPLIGVICEKYGDNWIFH